LSADSAHCISANVTVPTNPMVVVDGSSATGIARVGFNQMNYNGFGIDGWNNNATHAFRGKIYCVRLYSRALTADEIAANYAIDKIRFNLP